MTRHRFDAFSFLAGATAVTVGVLVLIDAVSLRIVDLRVIGPVLLLGFGLALLLGGGRDRDVATAPRTGAGPFDDPFDDPANAPSDDPFDDVSRDADGTSLLEREEAALGSDPQREEPGADREPG